jgi:hypothetical protein
MPAKKSPDDDAFAEVADRIAGNRQPKTDHGDRCHFSRP